MSLTRLCLRNNFSAAKKLILNNYDINIKSGENEYTALHECCGSKNFEAVKFLVENGANINSLSSDGSTPLLIALFCGFEEMARYLLTHGADIFIKNREEQDIIHMATYGGCVEFVKEFIHMFDVNYIDCQGSSYIFYAMKKKYYELVDFFITLGAKMDIVNNKNISLLHLTNEKYIHKCISLGCDINLKNNIGRTPLCQACYNKDVNCAKILLEHGADPNITDNENNSPLLWACCNKDVNCVKILLEYGANPNVLNNKKHLPLNKAIINNCHDIIDLLVEYKADVNFLIEDSGPPIYYAIFSKQLDCLKSLIKYGANYKDFPSHIVSPLCYAIENKSWDIVDYFIEIGVEVKSDAIENACEDNNYELVEKLTSKTFEKSEDTFYYAVKNNNLKLVRLLADKGFKPSEYSLILACYKNISFGKILIETGMNLNYSYECSDTGEYFTPLITACITNHFELIDLLLEYGADPYFEFRDGTTFTRLCSLGKLSSLKYLSSKGVDIKHKVSMNTETDLISACRNDNIKMVKYLIHEGSNIHDCNNLGENAITVAWNAKNYEIAEYLLSLEG